MTRAELGRGGAEETNVGWAPAGKVDSSGTVVATGMFAVILARLLRECVKGDEIVSWGKAGRAKRGGRTHGTL